jgi:spore coat polysaccharide biosynthesis protein SpsF (cytidylyltransferase family)
MKKKRVVLIIQARMGSTRLPGKSTMDLAGRPLVGRILERVKRCKKVDQIILAIPNSLENIVLNDLGTQYGVTVYTGSEDNLIDRYYNAAILGQADYIVRLPADNPTPEPSEIDKIIEYHCTENPTGFSSNLSVINNSGYPDGIGAEVFSFKLLEVVFKGRYTKQQQEHLHLNFFNYSTGKAVNEIWCPIRTIKCPLSFRRPELILDVNTPEQYQFMKDLYEYIYPKNNNFHITDIIDWYDNVYMPKNITKNLK